MIETFRVQLFIHNLTACSQKVHHALNCFEAPLITRKFLSVTEPGDQAICLLHYLLKNEKCLPHLLEDQVNELGLDL